MDTIINHITRIGYLVVRGFIFNSIIMLETRNSNGRYRLILTCVEDSAKFRNTVSSHHRAELSNLATASFSVYF